MELLNHPMAYRSGWVLLHSVWQGLLIGALFEIARFVLRQRSANARYLAGCLALALLLAAPVVTFFVQPATVPATLNSRTEVRLQPVETAEPGIGAGAVHSWIRPVSDVLGQVAPWLTLAWLAGVSFFSLKLTRGWWEVGKLRRRDTEPVDAGMLGRLDELRRRLGISRPVRLLKSALVEVPTVIGWLRPVILLPAATVAGLTPGQLEAILAHELAHVRRLDYVVNAFQCAVETLLFYHPVTWWISRCVREERENCCDDVVVGVCGDRVSYARALAALEMARTDLPDLAFAASGGSLLKRVRRLLGAGEEGPASGRQLGGLAFLMMGLALIIVGICLSLEPTTYAATARIRVERDLPAQIEYNGGKASINLYDPYFTQTEFEVIQSEVVLSRVVDSLGLEKTWGEKSTGRQPLKRSEAIALLRSRLELRPVPNTSLIEIRAFSDKPDEAARIANQVAATYRQHRHDQTEIKAALGMDVLKSRLDEHEAMLAKARLRVNALRKELNISDSIAASESAISAETLRHLEGLRIEAGAQAMKQERLLEVLKGLSRAELRKAAPSAVADNNLNSLLSELDLAEQSFVTIKHNVGPEHPDYKKATALVADLNRKIDDRIDGILAGLQAQVQSLQTYVKSLKEQVEEAKQRDIANAERNAAYFEAKVRLEQLNEFGQSLHAKVLSGRVDAELPRSTTVEIIDNAQPPLRPSAPNRPRAAGLIALGLLLDVTGLLMLKARPRTATVLHPA